MQELTVKTTRIKNLYVKESARNGFWCCLPYPGHPKGCPNYDKADKCPPRAEKIEDLIEPPYFMLSLPFNLKLHAEEMKDKAKEKGKTITDKQALCVLYWQNSVMAALRKAGGLLIKNDPSLILLEIPEANGLNVFRTAKEAGINLRPRPDETLTKIMIVGRAKGRTPVPRGPLDRFIRTLPERSTGIVVSEAKRR